MDMELTWLDLKPKLVEALGTAFNEAEFKRMISLACGENLDGLVAANATFPDKVFEVTGHAERNGWLECLVKGARDTNKGHAALQEVTAGILAGTEAEGAHFYQQHIIDE